MAEKGAAAIGLAKEGHFKSALMAFEDGECYRESAEAMSYYALCLAMNRKEYETALSFMETALNKDDENPAIHLNLGKLHLMMQRKDLAAKAFDNGLRYATKNAELLRQRELLGARKPPVIKSLPRYHFLNRFLGKIRASLFEGKKTAAIRQRS